MPTEIKPFLRDPKAIRRWIDANCWVKGEYEILDNGQVVVTGTLELDPVRPITQIMVDFLEVTEAFHCSSCLQLTSLIGAPRTVGTHFTCSTCPSLTSLVGGPQVVKGTYRCGTCKNIQSLVGAPERVEGHFYCLNNRSLVTLEGAPRYVGGEFNCTECVNLKDLSGLHTVEDALVLPDHFLHRADIVKQIIHKKVMIAMAFLTDERPPGWLKFVNAYAHDSDILAVAAAFEAHFKEPLHAVNPSALNVDIPSL